MTQFQPPMNHTFNAGNVVKVIKSLKGNDTYGTGYRAEELGSLAGSGFREGSGIA